MTDSDDPAGASIFGIVFGTTHRFEFDQAKSEANLVKHGIDFAAASRLWEDDGRIIGPARPGAERRSLVIGRIDGLAWTAVVTERRRRIRIISVRRARRSEVKRYEEGR